MGADPRAPRDLPHRARPPPLLAADNDPAGRLASTPRVGRLRPVLRAPAEQRVHVHAHRVEHYGGL